MPERGRRLSCHLTRTASNRTNSNHKRPRRRGAARTRKISTRALGTVPPRKAAAPSRWKFFAVESSCGARGYRAICRSRPWACFKPLTISRRQPRLLERLLQPISRLLQQLSWSRRRSPAPARSTSSQLISARLHFPFGCGRLFPLMICVSRSAVRALRDCQRTQNYRRPAAHHFRAPAICARTIGYA